MENVHYPKKDILLYTWLCFSVMHHRTSWLVRIWKLSFRHFKTWQLLCILKIIWSKFIDCGYMTITTRMYILITTKTFQKCKNELHLRINYSLEDSSWLIVKILQGMNGDSDWPLQGAGCCCNTTIRNKVKWIWIQQKERNFIKQQYISEPSL